MAYRIIGTIHKIGETETKQGRNGSTFQRRQLVIMQRRFDRSTGEDFDPNYPTLEFGNNHCSDLDRYNVGDTVQVSFEVMGTKYNERTSGEERYMNSLRAFRIEPYARQNNIANPPTQEQQSSAQDTSNLADNQATQKDLPF